MKKFIIAASLVAGVFLSATQVSAQQKIGHVNMGELVLLIPETKMADQELQKFGQSLEGQLKTMGGEYQNKLQDYQSKRELMADAIKQTKEKEILDLQNRIQEFQQTAQESIQKKKEELYAPILKRADAAVKEVAKENGYNYVIDSSLGVLLVTSESSDLGQMVRKKLGISATATIPNPNAPAGGQGLKK